jgi:GNAT superfamily N-acetyltransferase
MADIDDAFVIRPGSAGDMDLIIHFRRLLFEEMGIREDVYVHDVWEVIRALYLQELKEDRIRHFIAYNQDNLPVSVAGTLLKNDFPYHLFKPGYYGWIIDVYTLPEYRGRGLARRLMELNRRWLLEKGGLEAKLIASGRDARRFYERLGYRPTWELSLSLTDRKTYNDMIDARGEDNA